MTITIDEEELKKMVDDKVNEKIDALTDEAIKQGVQTALFDRVDGIFSEWKKIDYLVEKCVRENVEKQIPTLTDGHLTKACDDIANKLAYELRESVLSGISFRLRPDEEEEEEE